MAAAGVALMSVTIVVLAAHRSAPPPGATAVLPQAETAVGVPDAPAAAASLPLTPPAAPAVVAAPPVPNALTEANGVVSADVPLFGATPMATMEPAPLAPPPSANTVSEEAAERAAAKAAVSAAAEDESFSEAEASDSRSSAAKPSKKPEDVAPWGRGKVTTPVIHRLRLDSAGDALQGSLQPTGFTVVVPNRKVMEQGGSISKRDPRIARVRTVNTPNGAQVTFQFKDGVPPYKARLRRDFVEFLIGASEPARPREAAAKKSDKPSASAKSKSKSKLAAKAGSAR